MALPDGEWGKGKAFRCTAADCGAEINLYIRAKLGFCNCTTGVSDDDELNRLSDFSLIGDRFSVLGPGHPINCRMDEGPHPVLRGRRSLSRRTISVGGCFQRLLRRHRRHGRGRSRAPTIIEPNVIEFLNSKTILGWAEVTLGL